MSIYVKEKPAYLEACFVSLVSQSHPAAQVVVVEDGDIGEDLRAVVRRFSGCLPIKSVSLQLNVGLAGALNAGLKECAHELVARMDTDDVCTPDRLQQQATFMAAHPEITVLGAWVQERDAAMDSILLVKQLPLEHADIVAFTRRRNPIAHPVCMFRKQSVLAVGGYPQVFPEDYALWALMMVRGFRFANLPRVLLHMRTGDDFIARRGVDFLRREISLVQFLQSIKFLSRWQALKFFTVRAVLRLAPAGIRTLLYRHAR